MRRVVGVGGGEHASGGGGGFRKGDRLFEYGYADASAVEFKSEGETDDAGTSDAYVRMLHEMSLVGFSKV